MSNIAKAFICVSSQLQWNNIIVQVKYHILRQLISSYSFWILKEKEDLQKHRKFTIIFYHSNPCQVFFPRMQFSISYKILREHVIPFLMLLVHNCINFPNLGNKFFVLSIKRFKLIFKLCIEYMPAKWLSSSGLDWCAPQWG